MIRTVIKENFIYKYENLVNDDICNPILDYYIENHTNDVNDTNKLPWFEQNIVYWGNLQKSKISYEISLIRNKITDCVKKCYGETVFPNVSTLVMWKEGKSMPIHKDNGYENDKHILHMRKYSAVFYINDDYDGGETIILKENSKEPEIVNKPKQNSLLLFRSDESCLHGVEKVKKGNRLTFAMWFTTDITYKEI